MKIAASMLGAEWTEELSGGAGAASMSDRTGSVSSDEVNVAKCWFDRSTKLSENVVGEK